MMQLCHMQFYRGKAVEFFGKNVWYVDDGIIECVVVCMLIKWARGALGCRVQYLARGKHGLKSRIHFVG